MIKVELEKYNKLTTERLSYVSKMFLTHAEFLAFYEAEKGLWDYIKVTFDEKKLAESELLDKEKEN